MHTKELDEKNALAKRVAEVDDMYDLLAVHRHEVAPSVRSETERAVLCCGDTDRRASEV